MRPFVRQRPESAEAAPEPVYSQAQQRERRRKWLRVHYRGDFRLDAEVSAIVDPLAAQVAALPGPLVLRGDIDNVADAVHELVSTVVGMLAESKQLDRAAHARIARAVGDLAERPAAPEISNEHISAGSWAVVLHASPAKGLPRETSVGSGSITDVSTDVNPTRPLVKVGIQVLGRVDYRDQIML